MATATAGKSKAKGTKAKAPRKRRPRGRPPKIAEMLTIKGKRGKITRGDAIVHLLGRGLYVEDAAAIAGVARSTAFDWIARGEEWIGSEEVPENERVYLDFSVAVEKARAEAREVALGTIRKAAADGQWQAAAWYLERTAPNRYARVERREITGADGGPITLLDLEREVAEEATE